MGVQHDHRSVLLDAAIEGLNIRADGVYVDGTFGRGGHSAAILGRLGPQGRLFGFDKDPAAVAAARERFGQDARFSITHGSFVMMADVVEQAGLMGRVDGVLLDLGVSSPQLDDAGRGFSFMREGPLDMRMNPEAGESAADWLAHAEEKEIADVLWHYGEEKFSRRIARAVVAARAETPLRTTQDFVRLIEQAVPRREKHKHPATRSFQAVRIFVNRELADLEDLLVRVPRMLAPAGRLVVISFHSLEDRVVKRFMRNEAQGRPLPKGLPVMGGPEGRTLRLVGKAQRPGEAEVAANPRARSAVLRVAERLA
ncbi:MAG: 16S rRNA (cytosine(1402)-N(4))-methyltransferase RsmH [Gammaproteobacteria bacterium]|nr:16S rRNA (cytosine(1402)-N(4))-methyltransferase RsmH [Gammaproteobacteria bacterium]